jgi:hypothetical protein
VVHSCRAVRKAASCLAWWGDRARCVCAQGRAAATCNPAGFLCPPPPAPVCARSRTSQQRRFSSSLARSLHSSNRSFSLLQERTGRGAPSLGGGQRACCGRLASRQLSNRGVNVQHAAGTARGAAECQLLRGGACGSRAKCVGQHVTGSEQGVAARAAATVRCCDRDAQCQPMRPWRWATRAHLSRTWILWAPMSLSIITSCGRMALAGARRREGRLRRPAHGLPWAISARDSIFDVTGNGKGLSRVCHRRLRAPSCRCLFRRTLYKSAGAV